MYPDYFCEFSRQIAKEHGIEIAIILGFFQKCFSLVQGDEEPSYPTITHTMSVLHFWSEDKIRSLVADLYLKKLI